MNRPATDAAATLIAIGGISIFLGSFSFELLSGAPSVWVSLLTSLASTVAGLLVMLGIVRWWFPRTMTSVGSVAGYIAWFTVLVVARTLASTAVASQFGTATPANTEFRIVVGCVTIAAWLMFLTGVSAHITSVRCAAKDLRIQTAELHTRRKLLPAQIERLRSTWTEVTAKEVELAVEQCLAVLREIFDRIKVRPVRQTDVDDMSAAAIKIYNVSESEIRGLGHDLALATDRDLLGGASVSGTPRRGLAAVELLRQADELNVTEAGPTSLASQASERTRHRRNWRVQLWPRGNLSPLDIKPFMPIGVAIGVLYLNLPYLVWMEQTTAGRAGTVFVLAAMVFVCCSLAAWVVSRRRTRWTRRRAAAVFTGTLIVLGIVSAGVAGLYLGTASSMNYLGIAIASVTAVAGCGWVCASLAANRYDADAVLQSEHARNDLEKTIDDWLHVEISKMRRDVARFLHSTVQARFVVAASWLGLPGSASVDSITNDSGQRPPGDSAAGVRLGEAIDVLKSITTDVQSFTTPAAADAPSVEAALIRVADPWRDVVRVSFDIAADVELFGMPAQDVAWIAEESIVNAYRHGNASNVVLDIRWDQDTRGDEPTAGVRASAEPMLVITAKDNGGSLHRTPVPGLGVGEIEAAGGSVDMSAANGHTVVVVRWPVQSVSD